MAGFAGNSGGPGTAARAVLLAAAAFLAAVLLPAAGCERKAPARTTWPAEFPGATWETATPESRGFDSARLADLVERIRRERIAVHSLVIVRGGRIVLDASFFPYAPDAPHDIASATKSVTSILVGMLVADGKVSGIDAPARSFFPEIPPPPDARAGKVTLSHLLSMTSGIDPGRLPREDALFGMLKASDSVRFILERKMISDPGSAFSYNNLNTHLLSAVVSRAAGRTLKAYAAERLFGPLDIRAFDWPADRSGVTHGWGDLRLFPRDMARIGLLVLHRGAWRGRQVVPAEWIDRSTRKQVDVPGGGRGAGYGYGWWVAGDDFPGLFEARGRGGQHISVWPAKDLVLVMTGGSYDRDALIPALAAALRSDGPLPANAEGTARLRKAVTEALLPPAGRPVPAMPAAARDASGISYRIAPNPFDIGAISLRFAGGPEALLTMTIGGTTYRFPAGLDGVPRRSPKGPSGLPVALDGAWEDERTFVATFDETGRINRFRIRMEFVGRSLSGRITEASGLFDEPLSGTVAER